LRPVMKFSACISSSQLVSNGMMDEFSEEIEKTAV
jgi:hypothetical protein